MDIRGVTEHHDKLHPDIWDERDGGGFKLKESVRDKLLEIVDAFKEFVNVDIDPNDVTLTGSIANYNYSKDYSDIDLHLIYDFGSGQAHDIKKELFDAKKGLWNEAHDITIRGLPVEIYAQDIGEPHSSTGVYSVLNDRWVVKPKPGSIEADDDAVARKAALMHDEIAAALEDYGCDYDCLTKLRERVVNWRKAGLQDGGESSVENLAFKVLRRNGDIERLVLARRKAQDVELSESKASELVLRIIMGVDS